MNIQNLKKIVSLITLPLVFFNVFLTFYSTVPEIIHDLGRHILLGSIIVHTGNVPKINLLSYAFANYPFINSHWLSEVIFYIVDSLFGLHGLLILTTIISLLSFGLIYLVAIKQTRIKFENLYLLNFTALLYLGIYMDRPGIRPEIFSYFILSIFMYILYKYKNGYTKLIFLLIPLEALWVNSHIYFLIGVVVVGVFLLDELWSNRNDLKIYLETQKIRNFILVFIGVILVTFLNPNTYKGTLFSLDFFSNYGIQPSENFNIFYFYLNPPITTGMLIFSITAIVLILFLFLYKKRCFLDVVLSLGFIAFAMIAVRNVAVFVFTTLPIFVSALLSLDLLQKKKILILLTFFICIFIFIAEINILQARRSLDLDTTNADKQALDFFIKNNVHGPIYNNFGIGSYIAYRLYPKEKPFIDERPEAYPTDFFVNSYEKTQFDMKAFNSMAEKYQFNSAILVLSNDSSSHKQIQNFINNPSWKTIYFNPAVVIFVKNTLENNSLIKKYGMSESNFKISNIFNDFYYLGNLATLFNELGWLEQEIYIDKLIINIAPNYCPTLERLAEINHVQKINYGSYLQKYNRYCGELFF
ncbi:MAG: hypothetical protein ABSE17_03420 [Candidatus Levyibacteriota bacterium]|jgi:hypothetical protein